MWQSSTNFLPRLLTLVQKQKQFLGTKSMPAVYLTPHMHLDACIFFRFSENEFSTITLSLPHVLEAHEQSLTEVDAIPKCYNSAYGIGKMLDLLIDTEEGPLCRGRQQQTIMISAYVALLTHSRNLEMCPCKVRFILFKNNFFLVFLVHNKLCMMHVV